MDKPKYNYEGIFINSWDIGELVETLSLPNGTPVCFATKDWTKTEDKHITTSFAGGERPPYESIGTKVGVIVDGWAIDERHGLLALHVSSVITNDEAIKDNVERTKNKSGLHITIANGIDQDTGKPSKPVNSKLLFADGKEYEKITPVVLIGYYGGFTQDRTVDLLGPQQHIQAIPPSAFIDVLQQFADLHNAELTIWAESDNDEKYYWEMNFDNGFSAFGASPLQNEPMDVAITYGTASWQNKSVSTLDELTEFLQEAANETDYWHEANLADEEVGDGEAGDGEVGDDDD